MSEATLTELIITLTREAELFEEFLEQLDKQKEALVSNDVVRLNEITEVQQKKLATSHMLEERRVDLVRRLSEENQLTGDVTVSRLLHVVSRDSGRKLAALRDTICDLYERIEVARTRNGVLLDKSRDIIKQTLRIINRLGDSGTKGAEYSPASVTAGRDGRGQSEESHVSLALDRRV